MLSKLLPKCVFIAKAKSFTFCTMRIFKLLHISYFLEFRHQRKEYRHKGRLASVVYVHCYCT
jgi:hypothetical protein